MLDLFATKKKARAVIKQYDVLSDERDKIYMLPDSDNKYNQLSIIDKQLKKIYIDKQIADEILL